MLKNEEVGMKSEMSICATTDWVFKEYYLFGKFLLPARTKSGCLRAYIFHIKSEQ